MTTIQLDDVTTMRIKIREAESAAYKASRERERLEERADQRRKVGDENGALWDETHAAEAKAELIEALEALRAAQWDYMLATDQTGDGEPRRGWEKTANELRLLGA